MHCMKPRVQKNLPVWIDLHAHAHVGGSGDYSRRVKSVKWEISELEKWGNKGNVYLKFKVYF